MILVAPDPTLDEIYPIDGGWTHYRMFLFHGTHFVRSKIEPDESKDIRVFMQGLEERRTVDILDNGLQSEPGT
jgi:hypothetical protein